MRRTNIKLTDETIPVTPLDTCWSVDGRVYVTYADMPTHPPHIVGHLEDPTAVGTRYLTVIATRACSVPVRVHPMEERPIVTPVHVSEKTSTAAAGDALG